MEIFKEKEESEVVKKSLDPEGGFTIEVADINYEEFQNQSAKAKSFKEVHSRKETCPKSDLEYMDTKFKHPEEDKLEFIELGEVAEDFEEALISIEDLMEYLDNNEEQIDV
mgnify:CR=1 FL=1